MKFISVACIFPLTFLTVMAFALPVYSQINSASGQGVSDSSALSQRGGGESANLAYPPPVTGKVQASGVFDSSLAPGGTVAGRPVAPTGYPGNIAKRFSSNFAGKWKATGVFHPHGEGDPVYGLDIFGNGLDRFFLRIKGTDGVPVCEILRRQDGVWFRSSARGELRKCGFESMGLKVMNSCFTLSDLAFLFDFQTFLIPEARRPFWRVSDGVTSLQAGMTPTGKLFEYRKGFEAFFSNDTGAPVMIMFPDSRTIEFSGTPSEGADWLPGSIRAGAPRGTGQTSAKPADSFITITAFEGFPGLDENIFKPSE